MAPRMTFAREAILRLYDRLGPDDEFPVFGFNEHLFNITNGRKSRGDVADALAGVHTQGGTALYDAIGAGITALETSDPSPTRPRGDFRWQRRSSRRVDARPIRTSKAGGQALDEADRRQNVRR